MPYETTSIKISGSAADSKASVQVEGGDTLAAGQDVQTDTTNSGISIWLLIVVGLAGLLIGIGIGYLVSKKITAKS